MTKENRDKAPIIGTVCVVLRQRGRLEETNTRWCHIANGHRVPRNRVFHNFPQLVPLRYVRSSKLAYLTVSSR